MEVLKINWKIMKLGLQNRFLVSAMGTCLALMFIGIATAQTFTNLHTFIGSDGDHPSASLILSGNTLYGTTSGGGSANAGTVFAVNTDGTGFTNLHSFASVPSFRGPITNSDGAYPMAGLILLDNTLYGTVFQGGSSGRGSVFKVNTDGTGFTNLHFFTAMSGPSYTNSDGANPHAGLIFSDNKLYGTASDGGSSGCGTIFAIHTNGTGFTNLYNFTAFPASTEPSTNSDGANPYAGLILSGNTLYGTANRGGSSGNGTIFAVHTDGTGFTNLHNFTATDFSGGTNSDGSRPLGELVLSGNTLYGTAQQGGSSGWGTVFALTTEGKCFTILHNFTAPSPSTNSDGVYPSAGLILSGNTLYGTAQGGGSSGNGTVFLVNTDGTGFTNLHSFTPTADSVTNSDGFNPFAGLLLSGNTLYGSAPRGGSLGNGTLFSLSLPAPQLAIFPSGRNVILTWQVGAAVFNLQSTTNLNPIAIWSAVSPAPVVINGQNTVTNPVSGAQQFYRLSQ